MKENNLEKIRRKYPNRLTRGRAIKLYCKESCCAGDIESWKNCNSTYCFLWSFRMGKELGIKDKINEKNDSMLLKNKEKEVS